MYSTTKQEHILLTEYPPKKQQQNNKSKYKNACYQKRKEKSEWVITYNMLPNPATCVHIIDQGKKKKKKNTKKNERKWI